VTEYNLWMKSHDGSSGELLIAKSQRGSETILIST